jgi:methyl-accepting chemotaxis protein
MTTDRKAAGKTIDAQDRALRLDWIQFTDTDRQLIREAAQYLRPESKQIVREFYDHSFTFGPFVEKVTASGSTRDRLEAAQERYFLALLDADADADERYLAMVQHIGAVHAELDVKPRWNVGNYATYARLVYTRLAKHLKGDQLVNTILAFQRIFTLDASVAVESYMDGLLARLATVNERLAPATDVLSTGAAQGDIASKEIANAIQQVAQGASNQTQLMTEAREDMRNLTSAVQRVAEGAVQQATSLGEALTTAQATGEALEQVHNSSQNAASRGRESVSAAEEGMRGVGETIEAMETINHAVTSTSERIAALSESGREIGAITQTISEIAAQTNLLALNAAIEAARAGEMGRGFAVVADEVRSLAERVSNAAKDIAGLIEKVQVGVDRSVEAMSTTVNDVVSGAEKARQAGSALERIVAMSRELGSEIEIMERTSAQAGTSAARLAELVTDVGSLAEENTELAQDISRRSDAVTDLLNSVSAVAEESAASSEEVSASAEQVAAQMSEIATQGQSFADIATDLDKFLRWIGAIEDTPAAGRDGRPQLRALRSA